VSCSGDLSSEGSRVSKVSVAHKSAIQQSVWCFLKHKMFLYCPVYIQTDENVIIWGVTLNALILVEKDIPKPTRTATSFLGGDYFSGGIKSSPCCEYFVGVNILRDTRRGSCEAFHPEWQRLFSTECHCAATSISWQRLKTLPLHLSRILNSNLIKLTLIFPVILSPCPMSPRCPLVSQDNQMSTQPLQT